MGPPNFAQSVCGDPLFGIARIDFNVADQMLEPEGWRTIEKAFGDLTIAARFLHTLLVTAIRRNELTARAAGSSLSAREVACLTLAARNRSVSQIAGDLCVDVESVNRHFDSIRSKLGVLNRDEAIGYALKRGVIKG